MRDSPTASAAAGHPTKVSIPLRTMDPLSAVLEGVSLRGVVPGIFEMRAPWGIEFGLANTEDFRRHLETLGIEPPPAHRPPRMVGAFFAIVRGSCYLQIPAQPQPLPLAGGDFLLVNRPGPYVLHDDPQTPAKPFHAMLTRASFEGGENFSGGGDGPATRFVHGVYLSRDDQADRPLLASLPPVIHLPGDQPGAAERIQETVRFLCHELTDRQPGGRGIVHHLAHVLYLTALRAYFADHAPTGEANWFRGLLDPDIGHALGLMHFHPEEPWTVASLAERLNISRSAFAARFMAVVGMGPVQHLTHCRMRRAQALLRDTRLGLKEIAARVGYANQAAFSNAFRRYTGTSPGAYRRTERR